MQTLRIILYLFIGMVSSKVVDTNEGEVHNRVITPDKLSNHDHYGQNGKHDQSYDHEAFLGEEAEEFEHLTAEESKARLSLIVDKIDNDKDGFVTENELKSWIQFTKQRYASEDLERQWTQHNPENKKKISWKEYRQLVYGFLDDNKEPPEAEDEHFSYQKMEARDERRWIAADEDKDEHLNQLEFKSFIHPEEALHMRDIIVLETIEDIDKDGDGKLSLDEYIGDLYGGDAEFEPDWVKNEKEQFTLYRDTDQDGYMNEAEVKNWIIPADFDVSGEESKHLILESDANNDSKLTKDEILMKYDLFVGSQATDFGEALTRHDEF